MSLNQNIRWQPITQTLAPGAGQTQSLGQLFGDANTLITNVGDTFRDEATQRAVLDIGKIKTNLALKEEQEGILDNISQQGRGINEAAVLDAYDKQYGANLDRAEAARQRNEAQAMRDATKQVQGFTLKGLTSAELQAQAELLGPNVPKGPLLEAYQSKKAEEAGLARQAQKDAIEGIELNFKVSDQNQKQITNLFKEVEGLYPKAGKTETLADGSQILHPPVSEIIRTNPEYWSRYQSYSNGSALGQAAGKSNTGGGVIPAEVKQGIFKGEGTNGDYDTLYGNSHKGNSKFSGTKLTEMTVNQALDFSKKGGAYAEWSKTQKGVKPGEYATPMGAYQIVGSTLKEAAKALGLKGNEIMTPELQDQIADYVYQSQGSTAWIGYKGPKSGGGGYKKPSNSNSGPLGQTVAAPVTQKASVATGGFDSAIIGTARNTLVEVAQARNTKRQIEAGAKPTAKETSELNTWLKKEGYHQTSSLALGNDKNDLYALYSKDKDFQSLPPAKKKEALMYASTQMEENQGPLGINPMTNELRNYLHKWIKTDQQNTKEIASKDKLVKYNDIVEKAYVQARLQNPSVTREMLAKSIDPVMYKDLKAAGLLADKRPTY